VYKSSFCGRFACRWDDVSSDAGDDWALIQKALHEGKKKAVAGGATRIDPGERRWGPRVARPRLGRIGC
jgi:hypothetical protein